jgi:delta(3,5)-delta(2,4)-dienoyl-CoA isomerase
MQHLSQVDHHPLSDAFRYINLYQHGSSKKKVSSKSVVLIVELARQRKRNALNARLWKEIGQVFGEIGRTKNFIHVRSVLLIGQGKSFCAGIDVTDLSFFPATPSMQRLRRIGESNKTQTSDVTLIGLQFLPLLREMQACFTALEQCSVPIVAAIHGSCIGAGIDLVTAADVRLATADALFSVREVSLGLAADVGTLQRLPKICGNQAWVRSICLTGCNFDGREALRQGLVTGKPYKSPEEVWKAGLSLCQAIAQHNPVAVRGTKQALLYARDHSVAEGLEQIAAYNMLALQSPQMVAGMEAALTGEKPQYSDLPPSSRL